MIEWDYERLMTTGDEKMGDSDCRLFGAAEEAGTSGERINMNLPIRGRADSFKWPLGTLACL